jgi:hypothetical protein
MNITIHYSCYCLNWISINLLTVTIMKHVDEALSLNINELMNTLQPTGYVTYP